MLLRIKVSGMPAKGSTATCREYNTCSQHPPITKGNGKGKVHPITGHEGPEVE